MKASTFFTNSKGYLRTTNQEYLNATKQWFFKTPERALNQAYNAALKIQSIENEYFQGYKISISSTDCSDYLMSFVRADFQRELMISKLRLAEFKASCLILGVPVSAHLDKLSFLDGILAKYVSKENQSVAIAALPTVEKIDSNPVKQQSVPVNLGVVNVKASSDLDTGLLKTNSDSAEKVKKELDSAVVKKMQNPKIKISAAITSTALKYTVLLVVLPLLYQQVSKHFFQPASTATLQQELKHENHKSK